MTEEEKTQLEKLVEKYLKEDAYKPRGWGESRKEVSQRIKWRVASYVQL